MVVKETSKKEEKGIFERLGPAFIIISIVMAFAIGILWEKVSNLEGGKAVTSKATPTTAAQAQQGQQAKPNVTIDQIKKLYGMDLVKFGDDKRKVLFVDISDPSCPYCHVAAGKNPELNKQIGDRFKLVADGGTYVAPVPEMKKLVDQGKASYVFIYTPGHGNGEMGARALYCANEKGKYWEVHDLLFTNKGYELMNNTVKNDKTKAGDLADLLKSAVSASDMKSCMESDKYDKRLTADTSTAGGLGVSGTPALFVNATLFAGAYSYKDMESAVTAALK
jgi:protein-disulfide isomerase